MAGGVTKRSSFHLMEDTFGDIASCKRTRVVEGCNGFHPNVSSVPSCWPPPQVLIARCMNNAHAFEIILIEQVFDTSATSSCSAWAVTAAQEALQKQLESLLSRLIEIASSGCKDCGNCVICFAGSHCQRCGQCNSCYNAAALNALRQHAALTSIAQRIHSLHATHMSPEHLPDWISLLRSSDEWEAYWGARQSTASMEDCLQVLWDRTSTVVCCMDPKLVRDLIASSPVSFQHAVQEVGKLHP